MNRFMLIVLVFLSTALYIACSPKEKIFIIAPGDPIAANAGFTLTDYLSKTYHGMSFEFSETEIEGYRNIVLKISASGELENDESFRISGTADQLFITGKSSRALVNGVYGLLKQIGWSFYLSYDVPPAEPEKLNFTEIQIENTPLIEKRIVFNWHNFLSDCSSWDFEHYPDKQIVWFHPEGKGKVLDEAHLQELLDDGYAVISADLPGMGELIDKEFTGDGVIQGMQFNYNFGANLAGKSIAGIHAEAIDLLMQFIGSDPRFAGKKTEAFVQGTSASAFLLYAVLKNPFQRVTFCEFPGPAMDLIQQEYYDPAVAYTIAPRSLVHFDLPDLTKYLTNGGTEVIIQ